MPNLKENESGVSPLRKGPPPTPRSPLDHIKPLTHNCDNFEKQKALQPGQQHPADDFPSDEDVKPDIKSLEPFSGFPNSLPIQLTPKEEKPETKFVPFEGPLKSLPIQALPRPARPKKFTCDLCGKGVGSRSGLLYHIRVHLNGRPFRCDLCNRSYATRNDFETHNQRHSATKFQCGHCAKNFDAKQYLALHVASAHLPKTIGCTVCPQMFADRVILKKHIHVSHTGKQIKRYTCKLCWISLPLGHYKKHCQTRELLKYKCTICQQQFPCYLLLKKHREEEKSNKVVCHRCGKYVANREIHKRVDKCRAPVSKCRFCNQVQIKRRLTTHELECCTEEQFRKLNHQCPVCGKFFLSKTLLGIHQNNEHGALQCQNCKKTFFTKSALKNHTYYCKSEHIYKCVLCPKQKFPKIYLSRKKFFGHLNWKHSGAQRFYAYACDSCKKGLKSKRDMLLHAVSCYQHMTDSKLRKRL